LSAARIARFSASSAGGRIALRVDAVGDDLDRAGGADIANEALQLVAGHDHAVEAVVGLLEQELLAEPPQPARRQLVRDRIAVNDALAEPKLAEQRQAVLRLGGKHVHDVRVALSRLEGLDQLAVQDLAAVPAHPVGQAYPVDRRAVEDDGLELVAHGLAEPFLGPVLFG
jgi:hypothetical protein